MENLILKIVVISMSIGELKTGIENGVLSFLDALQRIRDEHTKLIEVRKKVFNHYLDDPVKNQNIYKLQLESIEYLTELLHINITHLK